jgi:hypothetical protein
MRLLNVITILTASYILKLTKGEVGRVDITAGKFSIDHSGGLDPMKILS